MNKNEITIALIGGFILAFFLLVGIDGEVARQERAEYGTEQTECLFGFNCWGK